MRVDELKKGHWRHPRYDSYVRSTTGSRHVCSVCKAKREERFMIMTDLISRFALPVWICRDNFCGRATHNKDAYRNVKRRNVHSGQSPVKVHNGQGGQ
jgi:hypothetical protein